MEGESEDEDRNTKGRSSNYGGDNLMWAHFLKWLFMSESKEELVKPFTEADMKTGEGIARLIVACVLLVASILYVAFVILVAIGGV